MVGALGRLGDRAFHMVSELPSQRLTMREPPHHLRSLNSLRAAFIWECEASDIEHVQHPCVLLPNARKCFDAVTGKNLVPYPWLQAGKKVSQRLATW